eukprot:9850004-Alexandrium_andersonii.AAC.1
MVAATRGPAQSLLLELRPASALRSPAATLPHRSRASELLTKKSKVSSDVHSDLGLSGRRTLRCGRPPPWPPGFWPLPKMEP